jgi:guanine deaminase
MKEKKINFMQIACAEARLGVKNGHGGPFGAVIVKNGKIISRAHNEVIKTNDPTAHAEVNAIRIASKKLGRFDLSDCEIYATCEPCPMCLSAIYWAKIKTLYFGCTKNDAAAIGFDDKYIFDVIKEKIKKPRTGKIQTERDMCLEVFIMWSRIPDKIKY